MKDGYLGIAPHATSSKGFIFKGEGNNALGAMPALTGIAKQNVWTWVIVSCIAIGWSLFISLWFHDYMVNTAKVEVGWVVTIESTITIGLGLLVSLVIVPELNKAFSDAPDIVDVDPSQVSISSSLQASFGLGTMLLGACASKKFFSKTAKKKNKNKSDTNEDSDDDNEKKSQLLA